VLKRLRGQVSLAAGLACQRAVGSGQASVKICITSGTFHPDVGGPPTYLSALTESLLQQGQRLRVVTYGRPGGQYPYPIARIPREGPEPLRLARFGAAVLRDARAADLLFVNDYGLPPALANLSLRLPLVIKIVGDFAWEYAIRHKLIPGGLAIDEFQRRRFSPRVEKLRAIQTWYCRRADLVITPSDYLAELVEGWGVWRYRLRVIYNAPPPLAEPLAERAATRAALGLAADELAVAYLGRLAPWKGVDHLVQAVELLRRRGLRMRLLVVGDGDQRAELERLAAPLGGAVELFGDVSRARALELLRAADALALPSAYEGLSHVVLEAMEAGKPIIASAVGGNLELIRDGENGLLVPYADPAALAAALERLASQPELASRLGQQARLEAEARSWPRLVAATLGVFEEALALQGRTLALHQANKVGKSAACSPDMRRRA
jgi:glycosyltransferase involved in cell wall biosynthesis